MSEIPLETLRELRDRVDQLLGNDVVQVLKEFLNKDLLTFRRKPDSESRDKDVNVTTTCSCVMALALTNCFHRFYFQGNKEGSDDAKALEILEALVGVPWMSSGLSSNNAFTTSLVLRTFGFLNDYKLLIASAPKKRWHLELNRSNQVELLKLLKERENETTLFLYRSLSDSTRADLEAFSPVERPSQSLTDALTADLRRIIHSGWIYSPERFPNAKEVTRQKLAQNPYSYELAELNHDLLFEAFPSAINAPEDHLFIDIAKKMAEHRNNFRINNYPPAGPVMYWFVDGVSRGNIELDESQWSMLRDFATEELNRQRSLVLADHDAMMDPVAMGMAACLCARLSAIVRDKHKKMGIGADVLEKLPSMVELLHSIKEVFKHQTKSGIWPKYFPMFHYQEAGSNFCFTFELLEAILHEFAHAADDDTIPNELLNDAAIIERLENAVTWCEHNRLETFYKGVTYKGWNSGGDLKTLKKNQPESWATAVVYMFLWELKSALCSHIQRKLLDKYKATPPKQSTPKDASLNELLDIELCIEEPEKSLKQTLKKSLVEANSGKTEVHVRREGVKQAMSALLFGPPGTSKTRLTAAIAEALGWPLVVVNPSDFVRKGFENVYLQADEIFRDMNDLSAVVVFFDEMDPLMQSRETNGLDTPTQFLTTSMLPQLTQLHDRGQVIFLVATNYISRFDPALMRAGRFDLLLCMGPPTISEKLDNLSAFFSQRKVADVQRDKVKAIFAQCAPVGSQLYLQLELYTFHEFKRFLTTIGSEIDIGDKLEMLNKQSFEKLVESHSKRVVLKISDLPCYLRNFSSWDDIPIPDQPEPPNKEKEIIKYLRDRKQSRKQYG